MRLGPWGRVTPPQAFGKNGGGEIRFASAVQKEGGGKGIERESLGGLLIVLGSGERVSNDCRNTE